MGIVVSGTLSAAACAHAEPAAAPAAPAVPTAPAPAASKAAKPKAARSAAKTESAAASIAPANDRAKESFDDFAREWMGKLQRAARETALAAKSSARTLKGFEPEWTTELKATGSSTAPFVGLLRYIEQEQTCSDAALTSCTVVSSMRVTEIFRFQGGKWIY